jgi:hypothetical protein
MSFLPADYENPTANSNYMKLNDGENKFRILSAPILGWEDWQDKKPIRYRMDNKPSKPIDPAKPIKHFWSMIVWNYATESIQILNITQAGIRSSLQSLSEDSDWGAPYGYDLKIKKEGSGKDTKYSISPLPHKEIPEHIKLAFYAKPCNLDALYTNDDPFAPNQKKVTLPAFEKDQDVPF